MGECAVALQTHYSIALWPRRLPVIGPSQVSAWIGLKAIVTLLADWGSLIGRTLD